MADIILENVWKSFGTVSIIEELNLATRAGEFMVLLGPSGSGKTTILRMVAGLEKIDRGSLRIGGVSCENLPPGQRGVAMVFQNYALYPHMTVAQNMAFGLENVGLGRDEIKARVREAARMLEMESLLERRPAQLSGGQRQRVAIGRAVVKQPKAFLFDEPLSNLDAALRVRTRVELAQLHQRLKSTVLYVTHDQTEAMTLADRIVVLNERKIEQIGTPMDIYHKPATRFVAGFVGSPAMNFLPITVKGSGRQARAHAASGAVLELSLPQLAEGAYELGVRPEALQVASGKGLFTGEIVVTERLGERTLLHVQLPEGTRLVAQDVGTSALAAGDKVSLKMDPAQVHFFDMAGKAIRMPQA